MKSLKSWNLVEWYEADNMLYRTFIVSVGSEGEEADLFYGNHEEVTEFLKRGCDKLQSFEDYCDFEPDASFGDYLTLLSEEEDTYIYIYTFPVIGEDDYTKEMWKQDDYNTMRDEERKDEGGEL